MQLLKALTGGIEAFKSRYEKVRKLLLRRRLWKLLRPFEKVIRFQKDTTWLIDNYASLKIAHENLQSAVYNSLRKKNDKVVFELGSTSDKTILSSLIEQLIEENILPRIVAEYTIPTDENGLSTFKEKILNCFKTP